jgi:hypothetical protein
MSKELKGTSDRVWLAGLGALAITEQEGNDLFQQLVRKGREVEKHLRRAEISGAQGSLLRVEIDTRETGKELSAHDLPWELLTCSQDSPLLRFLPKKDETERIKARQARRLAAARRAFLKEFGVPGRPAGDWERLQREGKIFTVTHRGATYVPCFQFDEKGKPRPAVAKVLQILGKDTSDWGLALWFTAANGYLDDKRPVDLLSSHPEEVVQAAEQEAAELVF